MPNPPTPDPRRSQKARKHGDAKPAGLGKARKRSADAVPTTAAATATATRPRCRQVLLVGRHPGLQSAIEACGTPREPFTVINVPTAAEARRYIRSHRVEVALVPPALPDGSGLDLAAELTRSASRTATLVVGDTPDFEQAAAAMRAGACDFLVQPVNPGDLALRLGRALDRRGRDAALAKRVRRLRRLCRKLNDARVDVSRQVDILCSDLVTAYQELAAQFQHTVQTSQFQHVVADELDLERLLRRTLEHLVSKAGPANAAIFLPASMDEYSLGGYVNYDCPAGALDMLLDHLADAVAPRVADLDEFLHLRTDAELHDHFGDDAAQLAGSEAVAVPCISTRGDERECLAVVVVFRDRDQPLPPELLELCSTMGPLMGTALEKVIRVHHRMQLDEDDAFNFDDTANPDDIYGEADDDDGLAA